MTWTAIILGAIGGLGWSLAIVGAVVIGRMLRLIKRMLAALNSDAEDWPTPTFLDDWCDDAEAVLDGEPLPKRRIGGAL